MKVRALVITGYGINCEEETNFALEMAGAESRIIHINDLIENKKLMDQVNILAFPGGFSYGDDTGSGKAFANKVKNNIFDQIRSFIDKGGLVIGICNGFQVLVGLGLLPALDKQYGKTEVALIHNNQARFECRWTKIKVQSKKCVFTKGVDLLDIPIAHGEGKFYADKEVLKRLNSNDQVVFRYTGENGQPAKGEYPYNPNGALEDIAGICDETGRVLGMMPHPERSISYLSHPDFQQLKEEYKRKGKKPPEIYTPALKIFENAVNYCKKQPDKDVRELKEMIFN
jgi:phosphoribosylformylglycinamidine synthase